MKKATWFCTIKNDIIIDVFHSSQDVKNIEQSVNYEYDEIKKMPDNFQGYSGLNIKELDGNKVKSIEQRKRL